MPTRVSRVVADGRGSSLVCIGLIVAAVAVLEILRAADVVTVSPGAFLGPLVILAGLRAGVGPGVLGALISVAYLLYYHTDGTFAVGSPHFSQIVLLSLLLVPLGLFAGMFGGQARRARELIGRLEQTTNELSSAKAALETESKSKGEILALLEKAQGVASTGSWTWDPVRDIFDCSPEATRILGVARPGRTLAGFEAHVHPDDRSGLRAAIERAASGEDAVVHEHRMSAPAGEVRWVQERAQRVTDTNGSIRVLGVLEDITQRKSTQDALAESEKRHRLLFELNPLPILVYDRETLRMLAVNQAAIRHYGYAKNEFLSKSIDQLVVPGHERGPGFLESLRKPREREGGWRHLKRDGALIDVEMRSETVVFEGREAVLSVITDVTERRRAEALVSGQNLALELMATGAAIPEVLEALAQSLTRQAPDLRCAVMLLDDRTSGLKPAAASGLSKEFLAAITVNDGTQGGSCPCSTSQLRDRTIIEDLLADPRCDRLRDVIAVEGLRGCWTQPILAGSGAVLGSVVLYSTAPRGPQRFETKLLEVSAYLAGIAIDRLRAEQTLKNRERLLRLQMEQMPAACIVQDAAGNVIQWNPAAERIFGWTSSEMIGKHAVSFLVLPEDRQHVDRVLARVLRGAKPEADARNRNATKSGRLIVCEWQNSVIHDEDGEVIGVMSMAQDVTEKLAGEQALRRSQELNQRIIDHMPGGLVQVGMDGRIIKANAVAQHMLGFTFDEITLRMVVDFDAETIYEDGRRFPVEEYPVTRCLQSGRPEGPATIGVRRPDGHVSWGVFTAIPLFTDEGKQDGAIVTFVDITERLTMEDALRRSEERYRRLADHGAMGIWEVARESGETVFANPAMLRILEVDSLEDLRGLSYRSFFTPESLVVVDREQRKRIRGEVSTYEVEIQGRRGGRRIVMITGAPSANPERGLETLIGTFTDITDRKATEDALRQAQKLDAVGRLASGIAHDFNNLLTAIFGYTSLARRTLAANHPATRSLDRVDQAAMQAGGVTRSLLTFTRQSGSEKRPVRLGDVVRDSVALLRRTLPAGVEIRTSIGPPDVWVRADVTQLNQVLMNLAINARDAMPEGGRLGISVEPPHGGNGSAHTATLTVSDTGVGMTPDVRARIFEPFFTTKPPGEGTGLGLPIILGIVQDHGGEIKVDSAPGSGTSVRITLPTTDPELETHEGSDNGSAPVGRGELLLLADDHTFVREIMASMLVSLGYRVAQAGDGPGLVDLFLEHADECRLFILDSDMPGFSGREALTKLRGAGATSPAILLSDDGVAESTPGLSDPGAVVLRKPFQMTELASAIGKILHSTPST